MEPTARSYGCICQKHPRVNRPDVGIAGEISLVESQDSRDAVHSGNSHQPSIVHLHARDTVRDQQFGAIPGERSNCPEAAAISPQRTCSDDPSPEETARSRCAPGGAYRCSKTPQHSVRCSRASPRSEGWPRWRIPPADNRRHQASPNAARRCCRSSRPCLPLGAVLIKTFPGEALGRQVGQFFRTRGQRAQHRVELFDGQVPLRPRSGR